MRASIRALTFGLALGAALPSAGQERVVNAGFEQYSRCPTGPGLIDGWLDSWHRTSVASTDFHHLCGFSSHAPRTGDGHVGLLAYDFSANYREYLTGQIVPPLEAGRTYRIEFHVILDEGRLHAVTELGAYFSMSEPSWPGTVPPVGIVPQVENAGATLADKLNWMLVAGTYVAQGGESHVTIGNFRDDASTTVTGWTCCGQYGAYYHLDDVSMVEEGQAPPCLYRADATSLAPLTPPASAIFMPETAEGLSLQGAPWQCPMADGDLERDPLALANGLPLTFYQIDRRVLLRLEKAGTTIRFSY